MPDFVCQNIPREKRVLICPTSAGIIQPEEDSATSHMDSEALRAQAREGDEKGLQFDTDHLKVGPVSDPKSCPLSEILETARQKLQRDKVLQEAAVAMARQELESKMSALERQDITYYPGSGSGSGSGPGPIKTRQRRHRRRSNKHELVHSLTGNPVHGMYGNELHQTPFNRGFYKQNWRMGMRGNLHPLPKQEHVGPAGWIQGQWGTSASLALGGHTQVLSDRLGVTIPDGQSVVGENWALREMIREYVGLNGDEIRFLLDMELMTAKRRWLDFT
ncbi:hypothetical protein A1O3_08656 [Capronia epimyces CBS 606.96]|uniref:Uncharacterized protein n=1 Tax=Capronia epimyces CBS 606.96 TaxID=1182542 RepID=W9XP93_9EURO|nr:uncharacterized protein A1O3_08656 [Capronia epimyces CBS 606.96]EXJ79155.1 hypothetical protein A1O3_08656 [Capronia epimyces CBS 606.96]